MLDQECDLSIKGFEVCCPGSFRDHRTLSYRFLQTQLYIWSQYTSTMWKHTAYFQYVHVSGNFHEILVHKIVISHWEHRFAHKINGF